MRAVKPVKFVILSLLLAVTAFLVATPSGPGVAISPKKPLQQVFSRFGQWQSSRDFPMDARVVEALDLDDFLFRCYQRDKVNVNLYIGSYHSAKKVGAAHDPLVCFQGQGWKINQRDSGSYSLARHPELTISYSAMLAERQGEREVVVYWFQANAKANASTQSQKVAMVLDKISGKDEYNAFVRLSAPVGSETPEAVRRRIFDFVEEFYPEFLGYVKRS
ncbi:MAG: EpsI family protein [Geobacteraceae bacterium GWC2_58_44]|nr:MAG: EpsI family protein [Geobacteraceae bacterium GWC2_58_44]HBG07895.1 EpsI family protein [Geobacter sp.]